MKTAVLIFSILSSTCIFSCNSDDYCLGVYGESVCADWEQYTGSSMLNDSIRLEWQEVEGWRSSDSVFSFRATNRSHSNYQYKLAIINLPLTLGQVNIPAFYLQDISGKPKPSSLFAIKDHDAVLSFFRYPKRVSPGHEVDSFVVLENIININHINSDSSEVEGRFSFTLLYSPFSPTSTSPPALGFPDTIRLTDGVFTARVFER